MKHPRALTHDEKKAAEAAYLGKPFHSSWSKSARVVYDGILKVRGMEADAVYSLETGAESGESQTIGSELFEEAFNPESSPSLPAVRKEDPDPSLNPQITSRQEAIDAGLLIDVSHKAKGVGFNLAVGITKSLWSRSISESLDGTASEGESRVRDMLLAVRLRLASLEAPLPWVEVPVLFPSSQGESTAKIFPIYALFHKDPIADECLTLIHPKELSSIRPSSPTNAEEKPSSSDFA